MPTRATLDAIAVLLAAVCCAAPSAQTTRASVCNTGTCIKSLVFSPDGAGGYAVTYDGGLVDPTPGTTIGLTDDDEISGPVDLGFPFPFPGGLSARLVTVDSNGRILVDSTETESDPTPTRSELLSEPWPVIACWSDFNLLSGGEVTLSTIPGVSATFTWRDVPQLGSTSGQTFQIQLLTDGTILVTFADLSGFNYHTYRRHDLLIGVSAGAAAVDPGESDFSAGPVQSGGVAEVYELFDAAAGEVFDLQSNPKVVALTHPAIGGAWHIGVFNAAPGASIATFVFGFARLDVDLGFLGIEPGCALLTAPVFAVTRTVNAQREASMGVGVPMTSAFGLQVFVQAATDSGASPGLPTAFSGRLEGTLGL